MKRFTTIMRIVAGIMLLGIAITFTPKAANSVPPAVRSLANQPSVGCTIRGILIVPNVDKYVYAMPIWKPSLGTNYYLKIVNPNKGTNYALQIIPNRPPDQAPEPTPNGPESPQTWAVSSCSARLIFGR